MHPLPSLSLSLHLSMALERLTLLVAVPLLVVLATARQVPFEPAHDTKARFETGMRYPPFGSSQELETRLNSGIGACWSAMLELRSCTNEIIVFFLNGESHLGQECCRAIHVITRDCWPTMLVSLGFTAEEGNILRGYCDASADGAEAPALGPVARGGPQVGPLDVGKVVKGLGV